MIYLCYFIKFPLNMHNHVCFKNVLILTCAVSHFQENKNYVLVNSKTAHSPPPPPRAFDSH